MHHQSITAISKNYRHSLNAHVVICADRRRIVGIGRCQPGNRNDVVVARATVAHLLTGERVILGDGGYRGIPTITAPARDRSGRIIRDDNYRTHRGSGPAPSTSSPDSKTGRYYDNATAAAMPSTTAFKSSPDFRTSKPTTNCGSPLSAGGATCQVRAGRRLRPRYSGSPTVVGPATRARPQPVGTVRMTDMERTGRKYETN